MCLCLWWEANPRPSLDPNRLGHDPLDYKGTQLKYIFFIFLVRSKLILFDSNYFFGLYTQIFDDTQISDPLTKI